MTKELITLDWNLRCYAYQYESYPKIMMIMLIVNQRKSVSAILILHQCKSASAMLISQNEEYDRG
jgi:hypothetical protein